MQELINLITENKAFLATASAWTMRELHIWGPTLKPALLYVRSEGGIIPFAFSFLYNPKPKQPKQGMTPDHFAEAPEQPKN